MLIGACNSDVVFRTVVFHLLDLELTIHNNRHILATSTFLRHLHFPEHEAPRNVRVDRRGCHGHGPVRATAMAFFLVLKTELIRFPKVPGTCIMLNPAYVLF